MKKNETSWGGVADWYDNHLSSDDDSYHRKVILPNLLRLMRLGSESRVLDIACGNGFFTREFAGTAREVMGVDVSKELIALAQKSGVPENVKYVVSPADKLGMVANGSVDEIALVLAIQNIAEVKGVLEEGRRALARGGHLHIVMNHPAFRIPKQSAWGWDESAHQQYRRIDSYLSESKNVIDMHPGKKSSPAKKSKDETVSFHRPLQYYFKLFDATGFSVARLEEWISHKKSAAGPRQKEEDRMRKEIPLFLYIQLI